MWGFKKGTKRMQEENSIKCNWCDWTGQEEDLEFGVAEDYPEDGEIHKCPECENQGFLMDVMPSAL